MAIYTKTGDRGKTSTFGGKRVSKSSKLISAIGAIDELNAFLGIVGLPAGRQGGLTEIQANLFTINSILSGAKVELPKDATRELEKQIDRWEGTLPVQKNFIFYGGSRKASLLFYARALCRRAERELVALSKLFAINYSLLTYINRLSDYLFMLARYTNFKPKTPEKIWKP